MTLRAPLTMALSALVGLACASVSLAAAELPPVKATDKNKVPSCATPGRLMVFLKDRNEKLDSRFDGIATEYMRHGEELSIRWDIAFFQMILETGNLGFTGDVKPRQNNFAGLGATGNGEPGESFKDVSTGVRAHLEHLLMYAGEKVASPVAERTRKVQEWGVLTEWHKSIKGPITFTQLARKWAPPARKYAADIETVADHFMNGACKGGDPRPELVAAARKSLMDEAMRGAPAAVAEAPKPAPAQTTAGVEAAKRAVEAAKSDGAGKSALGASAMAKAVPAVEEKTAAPADAAPSKTFTLINPVKPESEAAVEPAAAPAVAVTAPDAPAAATVTKTAAAGSAAAVKPAKSAARETALKEPGKCNVYTASYGGQKSVIIKVVAADAVNYTVLDVNEGAESRETDAYIAAYAKGGKLVGDFKSQAVALDKAFELCPEG